MTVKLDLPYLSPETDRHGNDRLYVRRNGRRVRIRQKPGTPEFAKAYAAAIEELASPPCATGAGPHRAHRGAP